MLFSHQAFMNAVPVIWNDLPHQLKNNGQHSLSLYPLMELIAT